MPKKESDLEKFLPALAALARGAAGGAMRRGMAAGGGGSGGGGEDAGGGPPSPDSDLASNISDMNRTKMYKAEPESEPVHPDIDTAMSRIKVGGTAGQMAEEMGFDPSKPMPRPNVTSDNHAEGAGVPLDNQGFTVKERAEMKKADKEISRQITEEQKRNTKPKSSKQKSIENALLKLMKNEDPRQGRLKTAPEADTPESEITQGKLPMSEAEERNLGNPERPFKRGWDTGKTYDTFTPSIPGPAKKGQRPGVWERMSPERQAEHPKGIPSRPAVGHVTINRRAEAIEDALLKLMKAPPQPGTPPGAPVTPNKPTVATPGASGGGTPGGAAAAPGGAAKTAPQTNPQVQQPQANPSAGSARWPVYTPTEHAKRPIQASIDKTEFPSGPQLSDDDWEIIREAAKKNKAFGEEHQPESEDGKYSKPNIQNIQNSLLKLMKAPTDLSAQRRNIHEQGKTKTSEATKAGGRAGSDLLSRQDLSAPPGGAGDAEAHALAGSAANLLGARAAQDFYGKLGMQSPQEFADTGGSRSKSDSFTPDANTPGDVGAATNPPAPPQAGVGEDGSGTGMPVTPKPNTASQTVANLARTTKQTPQPNPVDAALGRIKPNP